VVFGAGPFAVAALKGALMERKRRLWLGLAVVMLGLGAFDAPGDGLASRASLYRKMLTRASP